MRLNLLIYNIARPLSFLPREAMHKCGLTYMPSCGVCLSVCPSVCLSRSWTLSKRINISSKFFSSSSSYIIRVFLHQRSWQYFDGNPHNGGVECRCVRHESRFSTNIWLSIDDCCSEDNCDRLLCSLPHEPPRISESCVSQPCCSMNDHDEENRTEQKFIVRSGKS